VARMSEITDQQHVEHAKNTTAHLQALADTDQTIVKHLAQVNDVLDRLIKQVSDLKDRVADLEADK
jgi:predicted nuclease with TOPRIM domain